MFLGPGMLMTKILLVPLYRLREALLGPRELVDVTEQYPKRTSVLEAITVNQGKLIITCTEQRYHVRFPRFDWYRHYSLYHVCAQATGEISEAFRLAADFCVDVPATYPHMLNPHYSERAAIDHYLNLLKARIPETMLYRSV
jgi:hypothetical protein